MIHRTSQLSTFAVTVLLAGGVWAQGEACEADTDCDQGLECRVTGISGCAVPVCAPDQPCPEPVCETEEFSTCEPSTSCAGDADCADGMVCNEYDAGSCSISAPDDCDPADEDCVEAEVTEKCVEDLKTQCVYKWELNCAAAADCGEGFECVYLEQCQCAGAAPAGPTPAVDSSSDPATSSDEQDAANNREEPEGAPSNARPLPPESVEESCTCKKSDSGHCQAKKTECEADSDCPSGWGCENVAVGSTCSGGVAMGGTVMPNPPVEAVPKPLPPEKLPVSKDEAGDADGDPSVPPNDEVPAGSDGKDEPKPGAEEPVDVEAKPAVLPIPDCEPTEPVMMCVPLGGSSRLAQALAEGAAQPGAPATAGQGATGNVAQAEDLEVGKASENRDVSPEESSPGGENEKSAEDDDESVEEDGESVEGDDAEPGGNADADGGADEDEEDEEEKEDDEDNSCAVANTGAHSPTGATPWLLSLLGLAWVRRRRR